MAEKPTVPELKPVEGLTKEEYIFFQELLFNNKWNGNEWLKMVQPLFNKLGKIIDAKKD